MCSSDLATFTRIAYPEMKRHGYNKSFALGSIAGSGCLGMLIPPSVLMIVWGILTEQSIGQLFAAGVLPGLLLMSLFIVYIFGMAILKPEVVGAGIKQLGIENRLLQGTNGLIADISLFFRVVIGEVRTDLFPGSSLIN